MLARSEFTGRINWASAAANVAELLLAEFPARCEAFRDMGSAYYESRLHNEALSIAVLTARSLSESQDGDPISGLEFEQRCAVRLEALGYSCHLTKGSGDFGVDVLATRSRLSFAIQCKHLGRPVGVAAVQEAASGKKHYVADYAAVISNGGFTRAARELATSTSVVLVAIDQLADLEILARNLDGGGP
jgi:restriction system protein